MLMLEDRNVFDMNIHVEQTHSVFLFLSAASVSYGNHKYLAFFPPSPNTVMTEWNLWDVGLDSSGFRKDANLKLLVTNEI